MSIFPPDINEKMNNGSSDWLSGKDFEGQGLVLQIIYVSPIASQFGVEEDDYHVQQEILKPGETFRYIFKDTEGNERKYDTHSRPFEIGFQQSEVELNDWVRVSRSGAGKQTRYQVEKVDEVSHAKDIDPGDVPF